MTLKERCPPDSKMYHVKSFYFREAKEAKEKFWRSYSGVKTAVSIFMLFYFESYRKVIPHYL